ncbi:MAG: hypothetical protein Q4A88_00115 [Clostridia bacterium]|nr:hypothetical protein [Clostridia bacterium]
MEYEYFKETEKSIKEKTTIKETGTDNKEERNKFDGMIPIENTDQFLHLMEIYLSEWDHRDSSLWKQAFSYYTFTLAVIVFPYLTTWTLHVCIPASIPFKLFPVAGIVLSLLFIFVMWGYVRRFSITGAIYRKMIHNLPEDLREEDLRIDIPFNKMTVKKKADYILGINMSYIITTVMFLVLILFAVLILIYT